MLSGKIRKNIRNGKCGIKHFPFLCYTESKKEDGGFLPGITCETASEMYSFRLENMNVGEA